MVGFALGAVIGFALGVLLAQSRVPQRGFMPYIVGSQTIPILAIAPMVVSGSTRSSRGRCRAGAPSR